MAIIRGLFLSLFLLFPFGQLTRFPLVIPSVNFYLQDLIIALLLGFWFLWHLWQKRKFVYPPLAKPILFFIGVAFLSWLWNLAYHSLKETFTALGYLLRLTAYAGVYFLAWESPTWSKKTIREMLVGVGSMTAVLGLLQYVLLPDTRFLSFSGWDEHYFRLVGLHLDPGYTGIICVLTLILIIQESRIQNIIRYSLFTISYLALALTYSRASYLAYLMAMTLIAWHKKSRKFFFGILLVLTLTLVCLPRPGGEGVKLERAISAQARMENYLQALRIVKDQPLLGVGFNFYRYIQRDYGFLGKDWETSHAGAGVDSSLIFILATTGVIGLISFFSLVYKISKYDGQGVGVSGLALLVHSFFNNSLFYPWLMLWWWLLLATKASKSK